MRPTFWCTVAVAALIFAAIPSHARYLSQSLALSSSKISLVGDMPTYGPVGLGPSYGQMPSYGPGPAYGSGPYTYEIGPSYGPMSTYGPIPPYGSMPSTFSPAPSVITPYAIIWPNKTIFLPQNYAPSVNISVSPTGLNQKVRVADETGESQTIVSDSAADTAVLGNADSTSADSGILGLIPGSSVPRQLQLKDLDSTWHRITLGGPLDIGHWLFALSTYLGTPNHNYAYTKGQTVTVGGETYIVAYRPLFTGPGLMGLMAAGASSKLPDLPKLTPDTTLSLSLLNLRTVGSLDDVRNFDLDTEVSDSAREMANLQTLLTMMQSMKPAPGTHHAIPPHRAAPKKSLHRKYNNR